MTDLALRFDPARWSADLELVNGDLATDEGLMSGIVITFFTDARARDDDALPQGGADRRGWWGDAYAEQPGSDIGSLWWLLSREKLTETTALKAREIFEAAGDWFVRDGVVRELIVETMLLPRDVSFPDGGLAVGVTYSRPDGPARQRFDFVWDATTRSLA